MQQVSRRTFLQHAAIAAGGAVGLGFGGGVYVFAVEPRWLDLVARTVILPRLAPQFHGYRIAHISDIHMDEWMSGARLHTIVDLINEQQPDLVAITGDFVTHAPTRYAGDLAAALRRLAPHDGTVAVLGNHDHWTDPGVVRRALRNGGVIELGNAVQRVERAGAVLHVCGVDDVLVGEDRLGQVLDHLPADGAALLLAHEPDFADTSAATGRFDLQLSGHSHGGQVRVPLVGAPRLPPLGRKYSIGQYQIGSMTQYTSRGIGMIAPRVRFGCRPEVTLLTLAAQT
jgi:hypothetical protein